MSQLRLFDNQAIESEVARLGTVAIEDEDIEYFVADASLVLVVTVTVDGAGVKRLANGEWQRSNALSVSSMRVATGEMRDQLIEIFGLTNPDEFFPTLVAQGAPPAAPGYLSTEVDTDTGELTRDSSSTPVTEPPADFPEAIGRDQLGRDPALARFLAEAEA